MIDIQVRIHDRYSVEFKIGYVIQEKSKENEFMMNTWFFIPYSLDINANTYSKQNFYKDVKSNIRLITPIFSLKEIAESEATPFVFLGNAFDKLVADVNAETYSEYEYQLKMFASMLKSALREEVSHIAFNPVVEDRQYLLECYLTHVGQITERYRNLRRKINVVTVPKNAINYFFFCDEYISNLVEFHTFRLLDRLKEQDTDCRERMKERLMALIRSEICYKRERGYMVVEKDSPENNRTLIYRRGILKKFAESELFLGASKKRDGIWVEQVYYSLAAGLSMIFATIVTFYFQQEFGNFTMPLFVALVISYMLKDRIKDLMRYYFAHRLSRRYFDHKTTISIKNNPIGWIKEGCDFISEDKVPEEVMKMRARSDLLEAENRMSKEGIILYRKLVRIDPEALLQNNRYETTGVNDIMRFNVEDFLEKMDSHEYELDMLEEGDNCGIVVGEKIYYINFLMQFQHEGTVNYRRFRLVLTRNGIHSIREL